MSVSYISIDLQSDLSQPHVIPRGYAMQGDAGFRVMHVGARGGSSTFEPPAGFRIEVRYTKPDGTGGIYDTLPDGSPVLIEQLLGVYALGTVPQMFTVPGPVKVSVAFIHEEKVIATFPSVIEVIPCPGINVKSENYENLSPYLKKTGWAPGKVLGTDETGKVVEVDAGGGVSGTTVTAVAVTENADGSVTMVNTLSDGSTETIVVTADAEGNPNGLTVNGTAIPLTWTEVTA